MGMAESDTISKDSLVETEILEGVPPTLLLLDTSDLLYDGDFKGRGATRLGRLALLTEGDRLLPLGVIGKGRSLALGEAYVSKGLEATAGSASVGGVAGLRGDVGRLGLLV